MPAKSHSFLRGTLGGGAAGVLFHGERAVQVKRGEVMEGWTVALYELPEAARLAYGIACLFRPGAVLGGRLQLPVVVPRGLTEVPLGDSTRDERFLVAVRAAQRRPVRVQQAQGQDGGCAGTPLMWGEPPTGDSVVGVFSRASSAWLAGRLPQHPARSADELRRSPPGARAAARHAGRHPAAHAHRRRRGGQARLSLQLVAEGLTNPQIGARMFISRGTVKVHLSHIFAKVGLASRAELSADATRRSLSTG